MKIYKKDTKGKIRFLEVYADGDEVVQRAGLIDGKITERRHTAKAKNIGKVNETTPSEQAQAEAASKIENKMSEGYFKTQLEAETYEVKLPMLATSYEKIAKKIEYPCYAQPKLDGMRAFYNTKTHKFISRKGKEITTVDLLSKGEKLIEGNKDLILDGELYSHELTFQECMSAIKKHKSNSHLIKFHAYDIVLENEPFDERYAYLKTLKLNKDKTKLVNTRLINSEEEMKEYHKKNIELGFEGTMVRWGEKGYEVNKRSQSLLKYKDFLDIAEKIVDVVPSDKNPEQGVVVCEMKNGKIFNCGMKFSHEDREAILRNKQNYIGRTAEVRFFEWTDGGIPRFPVCVGFRLDK